MKQASFIWDALAIKSGLDELKGLRAGLLSQLTTLINEFHQSSHSLGYIDLIAGSWLEGFSHQVYFSWREVNAGFAASATSSLPIFGRAIDATRMGNADSGWHEHLRGVVCQLLDGGLPKNWTANQKSVKIETANASKISGFLRNVSTKNPKVLITSPGFRCPPQDFIPTLMRWRSWVSMNSLDYPISIKTNFEFSWRKARSLACGSSPSSFRDLIMMLMPLYIPVALLEGLEKYRSAVLSLPLSRPLVVYSANGLYGNLTFKLLMAEWRKYGTKLLYHQHGGGYGLEPQLAVEDYEIRVSDKFYSWGWQKAGESVYPLSPAMPLKKKNECFNQILVVCLDLPKVPYKLMFAPMPGTIETMHQDTCLFLEKISDLKNLIIRPYPEDYGWGILQKMREVAPQAIFDTGSKLVNLMLSSQLVVMNYLGTSWLETLGLNIPTICFYDPEVILFNEESQKYVDSLHAVGVLHYSGKEAADFIKQINGDINGWWGKLEVQQARNDFVKKYANFSENWQQEWEREFESTIDTTLNGDC